VRLIFIYGPPAVGKLTVARELAALTGIALFHNHVSIDAVRSVFPRGSLSFARLVPKFRRDVFAEAAEAGVDVIFTFVYANQVDDGDVADLVEPVTSRGGELCFVQLTCRREELLRRVVDETRRGFRKLADPTMVARLLERYDLTKPIPLGESFRLDTTELPAREAAQRIATHFGLPRARA
jgi:tRNA uridine 5-carbamoylmethylation protein Kti12